MIEVVEAIIKRLVDDPEDVQITKVVGKDSTVIEVDVHPDDRGKIIGKKGCIAGAIRTILAAVGGKDGIKYSLDIIEDEDDEEETESSVSA